MFSFVILGNNLFQWGGLIIIMALSMFASRVVIWRLSTSVRRLQRDAETDQMERLVRAFEQPLFILLLLCGVWLGMNVLSLSAEWRTLFGRVWQFLFTCITTWMMVRAYDYFHITVVLPKLGRQLGEDFLSTLGTVIRSTVWVLGILMALNNAGYDVTAIIASLGIVGLAVALAAQDTVANLFGGVTIFTQQPFKAGDRIEVAQIDGWVKSVGFRSSRMLDVYGQEIIVPNRYFAENPIRNISSRDVFVVSGVVPLSQSCSPEAVELFVNFLRELGAAHPSLGGNSFAGVRGFGRSSIDVEFWFEIKRPARDDAFLQKEEQVWLVSIRSDIHLRMMAEMRARGLDFAQGIASVG